MLERLLDYRNKVRVLRQVASNKARRFGIINTAASVTTVAVSSVLAFIGFAGITKIKAWVNPVVPSSSEGIEVVFNVLVLILTALGILHLVFRFGARELEANRAIVMLTHLSNEIDDLVARADAGHAITVMHVDVVRSKYDTLLQVIPPNSDREFLKAKADFQLKTEKKRQLAATTPEVFDGDSNVRLLRALVLQSQTLMQVLVTLKEVDKRLYLGGGVVRNLVWDHLHGHKSQTPIDDVDVIYFDRLGATKEHDVAIESQLRAVIPNLTWSVKNQARMHSHNGDDPYSSLEDALSKWPETATSVVVRLADDGEIELVAPFGLTDLFRLVVCPTPHFRRKLDRYRERVSAKAWHRRWPLLRLFDVEEPPALPAVR